MPDCELCEAAPITTRYHEDDVCWIAECEGCAVPMVVWKCHGVDPDPADDVHMLAALEAVAGEVLGEWWIDRDRRTIPDHWHVHARPKGRFNGW